MTMPKSMADIDFKVRFMARTPIMGVGFDNITAGEALDKLCAMLETGDAGYVVTPNPEIVYAAVKDPSLVPLLENAALCVPDGIGIIYAGRIMGTPFKSRVPGIELGEALVEKMAQNGKKLFLLGAKPGIAELAADNLQKKYPGLVIAGTHDGYFKDDAPVVELIKESQADVVFVCMGFPRQERFMAEHLEETGASVMMGLGGSLDVFAGTVKRAPKFFIKTNLEWFYRLIKEPSRIGRMMKLPVFLLMVCRERIFGKKNR